VGEQDIRVLAVEPAACPSLTRGQYAYDFGDTGHLTPLVKMHTLGSTFVPAGIHAGGLRYHGMAPLVSHLLRLGEIEAIFSMTSWKPLPPASSLPAPKGIIPAPEANHGVSPRPSSEALKCKEEGVSRAIFFNLCGHGHFDMQAYIDYQAGKLVAYEYPEEEIAMALAGLAQPRLTAAQGK
jgi:tryptophan synthase beta chain